MGNTASVEEPGLGGARRTSHKLSKPRTVNHETNTLPSPIGLPDPRRRFSTMRTASLPYGTSPVPSPIWPPTDPALESLAQIGENPTEKRSRSRSITRTATALFRSRSSQVSRSTRRRQDSLGQPTSSESARPSRANSMIVGPSETPYIQSPTVSRPPARTRTSVTYDLNSYEAKRLLLLTEEPLLYEKDSIASESHFQVAVPQRRDSILSPTADKSPTGIPRANSDVSMYTPMRRRSLLTVPGVATRIPDVPAIPRKSKARFSLPSTPARRDSMEFLQPPMLLIPQSSMDPSSQARASTPCDEDYGHTGAFKLGSLRIMNGSPAISPAVDSPRPLPYDQILPISGRVGGVDYFEQQAQFSRTASLAAIVPQDGQRFQQSQKYLSPLLISPRTAHYENGVTVPAKSIQYLPEVHSSPLVIQDPAETDMFALQTTSKHTALEDDLFEDEQTEYSPTEHLDIRLDPNAKSLPPRPRLISEGRSPREMMRPDSGVAATPISEHPHGSLAKSDSGYSSNMSLRSFSVKPLLPENVQALANGLDSSLGAPTKDMFPPELSIRAVGKAGHFEVTTYEAIEGAPPPVPRKDPATNKAVSAKDYMSSCLGSSQVPAKGDPASSSSTVSDMSPLSPTSPTTSGSGLSGSSSTRKPGKFERLLYNARKPPTVHMSQPSKATDDSGLSKEAEGTLDEQSGSFTLSLKRLALRPEPSKATLRTIASVGSAEFRDEIPPVPILPKIVTDATQDERRNTNTESDMNLQSAKISSSQVKSTTGSTRKLIARKPVPIRKDSLEVTQLCKKATRVHRVVQSDSTQPTTMNSNEEYCHESLMAAVKDRETQVSSDNFLTSLSRPEDLEPTEFQHLRMGHDDSGSSIKNPLPSVSTEASADQTRKTRSPPISMKTRRGGSSRATPPTRAKSTPPVASRVSSAPDLPRISSRENVQSYPPSQPPPPPRQLSRENVHSYPPALAIYENLDEQITFTSSGPMDRRCSMGQRTNNIEHRLPKWEVRTDHESSQRVSSDQGQRHRLASQDREGSQHKSRQPLPPQEAQGQIRPLAPRRQSSYDSYSFRQIREAAEDSYGQNLYQDNGPYPSIPHTNGHSVVSEPWSGLPITQSPNIQSRYPPHAPCGHTKTDSSGSNGIGAPYRVLHSYNSPAYKNSPIWG